jgi:hypothetical protein
MKFFPKFKENWKLVKPHLDTKNEIQKKFFSALFAALTTNILMLTLVFGGAYYFLNHVPSMTVQIVVFLYIVYSVISAALETTVTYIKTKHI